MVLLNLPDKRGKGRFPLILSTLFLQIAQSIAVFFIEFNQFTLRKKATVSSLVLFQGPKRGRLRPRGRRLPADLHEKAGAIFSRRPPMWKFSFSLPGSRKRSGPG